MLNGLTDSQLQRLIKKLSSEKEAILEIEKEIDFYRGSLHHESETLESGIMDSDDSDIQRENYYLNKVIEINNALESIHKKTYGICVECGQNIGFALLNSYPMARHCTGCKSSVEQLD